MTTSDARKRLDESIDRLERYATRTHAINPDTGQFTRLDQEDTMTDQPEPYDFHDEAHRALLNDNLSKGRQASLHALLAIHDTLTEIRDRLPERPTLHALVTEEPPVGSQVTDCEGDVCERREGGWSIWMSSRGCWTDLTFTWESISENAPLRPTTDADRERVGIKPELEWLAEPVPVPHPDEALARIGQRVQEVRDGSRYTIEVDGVLIARCDTYGRTVTERSAIARAEKAEADLARVTKERDEAWRFRDAALEARDKAQAKADRYDALRADVERHAEHDAAVAARALREAADEVYGDDRAAGPYSHPLSGASWLRERADRIEREGGASDAHA